MQIGHLITLKEEDCEMVSVHKTHLYYSKPLKRRLEQVSNKATFLLVSSFLRIFPEVPDQTFKNKSLNVISNFVPRFDF